MSFVVKEFSDNNSLSSIKYRENQDVDIKLRGNPNEICWFRGYIKSIEKANIANISV